MLLSTVLLCSPAQADLVYIDNNLRLDVIEDNLYVDGLLLDNSYHQIQRAINDNGITTVYLNSYGGMTREGYLLGFLFRNTGVTVIVRERDVCASACGLALLGAEQIIIDGYVAFHSSYYPNFPYDATLVEVYLEGGVQASRLLEYLIGLGYSYSLGTNIINITNPSIFILFDSGADLLAYRVEDVGSTPEREQELYRIVSETELLILAQQ